MKKSELLKRIEALESMQEKDREKIGKIREDVFHGYQDFFGEVAYSNTIPTYQRIKKIMEHLGLEIYETTSEIKVRSVKAKKKKRKK